MKSYRIQTNKSDKHIKVTLDQTYETIEVLSLTLSQSSFYNSDTSRYGVVIGRIENNGVGIPNAKVSVFIPITDEDSLNEEILALYPFKKTTDKGYDNKRYNLLPKNRENNIWNYFLNGVSNLFNGFGINSFGLGYKPETPVGSFFSKDEISVTDTLLEIYRKYYKYTAVTNESGDYCIFGVPLGQQTVHIDLDLTDIGYLSMKPIVLSKLLDFPRNLFTDSGRKIKKVTDLNNAPHIISQDLTVEVIPFSGLSNVNGQIRDIGFTRADFTINAPITPTSTIFSAGFTMDKNAYWYDEVGLRIGISIAKIDFGLFDFPIPAATFWYDSEVKPNMICGDRYDISNYFFTLLNPIPVETSFKRVSPLDLMRNSFITSDRNKAESTNYTNKCNLESHRNGEFDIMVFDHKRTIEDGFDNSIYNSNDISSDDLESFTTKINFLNDDEYILEKQDGSFCLIIKCNTDFMITNEFGELVPSGEVGVGLPMSFYGSLHVRMKGIIDNPPSDVLSDRLWLKIPQIPSSRYGSKEEFTNETDRQKWINRWILNYHKFENNQIYTVFQKYGITNRVLLDDPTSYKNNPNNPIFTFEYSGLINNVRYEGDNLLGFDISGDTVGFNNLGQAISGKDRKNTISGEYVNMCLYFPQYGYRSASAPSYFTINSNFNTDRIGAGLISSKDLAVTYVNNILRDENNQFKNASTREFCDNNNTEYNKEKFVTGFIKVPRPDIIKFYLDAKKSNYSLTNFLGDYKKHSTPYSNSNGAVRNDTFTKGNFVYFKGLKENDVIDFIIKRNLI